MPSSHTTTQRKMLQKNLKGYVIAFLCFLLRSSSSNATQLTMLLNVFVSSYMVCLSFSDNCHQIQRNMIVIFLFCRCCGLVLHSGRGRDHERLHRAPGVGGTHASHGGYGKRRGRRGPRQGRGGCGGGRGRGRGSGGGRDYGDEEHRSFRRDLCHADHRSRCVRVVL